MGEVFADYQNYGTQSVSMNGFNDFDDSDGYSMNNFGSSGLWSNIGDSDSSSNSGAGFGWGPGDLVPGFSATQTEITEASKTP